ncbi:Piso0_005699 [Millerozyma farinosa CBS 7064]|uniref:Piso0_005699 protein n=1 Tax=Pichia sorbitophila (strain ATCC MYA-4447 / BCRC 22081 / CBS 7064 / NBRC 10061 / NRRL Y-12695) TaxID=559304 RepID=G8Y2P1_PICSO|nr:Piso0_005699 [Millerozyma farinosa CBS 7064]
MVVRRRKAETEGKEVHSEQTISSSRAVKASFITFLSLFLLIIWGYHGYLVFNGFVLHYYEDDLVSKIVLNVSLLMLHGWLSLKLLTYLNMVMLDNDIDSDHKKYL